MKQRTANESRATRETTVDVKLNLDGSGECQIDSGIGFLDHLLGTLGKHSGMDIELRCQGDLEIDDHHSVEDCALTLGRAVDHALGNRVGVARFGTAYVPLDEALARAVVDLSGRPFAQIDLGLRRQALGTLSCENIGHFLGAFASACRATLHIDVLRGVNDHHRSEAAFKALAMALRSASGRSRNGTIPSIKGVL